MSDIEDRLAIGDLIARYSDALNRRDFAAMAALFTPDARWSVDPPFDLAFQGEAIGPSIAAMLEHWSFLLQMVMGSVIDLHGDRAAARNMVREIGAAKDGASGLDSYGLYHDRLVRTAGGWRFESRRFQSLHLDTAPLAGAVVGQTG
jgi:ketosteroid isomerase-like protein